MKKKINGRKFYGGEKTYLRLTRAAEQIYFNSDYTIYETTMWETDDWKELRYAIYIRNELVIDDLTERELNDFLECDLYDEALEVE